MQEEWKRDTERPYDISASGCTAAGKLHHFIVGFEVFHDMEQVLEDERLHLEQYYEQMKQSILENSNYIEALLETAEALYTVNLTQDRLEQIFQHRKKEERIFDFSGRTSMFV